MIEIDKIRLYAADVAENGATQYDRRQGRRILKTLERLIVKLNPELAPVYDFYRMTKPQPNDGLIQDGPVRKAYFEGAGNPYGVSPYPQDTVAYAAWLAGVDNAKEAKE